MRSDIKNLLSKIPPNLRTGKTIKVTAAVAFAIIGSYLIFGANAATTSISLEAENGQIGGAASPVAGVGTASKGGYVQFGTKQLPSPGKLNGHAVVVDGSNSILSWLTPQNTSYDQFMRLGWNALLKLPKDSNGIPKDLNLYSTFDQNSFRGSGMNDVGEKNPPFVDAALRYYAYSGDKNVIDLVSAMLSYQLTNGTTSTSDNWSSVPYGSANGGDPTFSGYDGGSGSGVIETDKVGDVGNAYLKMYEYGGDAKFRDAAISSANALASHVRTGSATKSPWPWRVNARDNSTVIDYTANIAGTLDLFDGLIRLNLGNVASYTSARQTTINWLMAYPVKNNAWANYFNDDNNDISGGTSNLDQFSPMEVAIYLMKNPQVDPNWKADVQNLIRFVENKFVSNNPEPGNQFGANAVAEQSQFLFKTTSATARYAAVNALLYRLTGDQVAYGKAYRSLNWSTYMMLNNNGAVRAGPNDSTQWWWTDGYGDPFVSFLTGMASAPEWSPAGQNHLLESTSVIKTVAYGAADIAYQTAETSATEILRVSKPPSQVTAGAAALGQRNDLSQPGWTYDAANGQLHIFHTSSGTVRVVL